MGFRREFTRRDAAEQFHDAFAEGALFGKDQPLPQPNTVASQRSNGGKYAPRMKHTDWHAYPVWKDEWEKILYGQWQAGYDSGQATRRAELEIACQKELS